MLDGYTTTTTTTTAGIASAGMIGALIAAILVTALVAWAIMAVAGWKIFEKAGVEGWKALIPFYNTYLFLEIGGYSGWLVFLTLVPYVGSLVVAILMALGLAKNFGKSTLFAVFGLLIFSIVGYLMLAFGSDKYIGGYFGGQTTSTPSSVPSTGTPNVAPSVVTNPSQTTPPSDVTPPQV